MKKIFKMCAVSLIVAGLMPSISARADVVNDQLVQQRKIIKLDDGTYYDARNKNWTIVNGNYYAKRPLLNEQQLNELADDIIRIETLTLKVEKDFLDKTDLSQDDIKMYKILCEQFVGNLGIGDGTESVAGITERLEMGADYLIATYIDKVDDSQKQKLYDIVNQKTNGNVGLYMGYFDLNKIKNIYVPQSIDNGIKYMGK